MITLAEKLITGSKPTEGLEVSGYVEFVSSTPMSIEPVYTNPGVTLLYSLNGTTWEPILSGRGTPYANIIYFIGSATGTKSLYFNSVSSNSWYFRVATNLECNGKLDRLLQDNLGGDNDILTIGDYCFCYMFHQVTPLIKAPKLPATTLSQQCYMMMFKECVNLAIAPELPATTVASHCYYDMFRGCTSITTAPKLPATTVAIGCYYGMLYDCTKLTTPASLPATTLAESCYYNMFRGCSSIKVSTTATGIYDTAYRIPTSGMGTTAGSALTYMFAYTGGTFAGSGTPTINTTYYTENTPV